MKNQFFLISFFCLISNDICSMNVPSITVDALPITLDQASADRLVECAKAEILEQRKHYWPDNVVVTLKQVYLVKDQYEHTGNPRYAVSLIGRYSERGQSMRRDTTGTYFKEWLVALNVHLPE